MPAVSNRGKYGLGRLESVKPKFVKTIYRKVNDPVKQMLAGLNKSLDADNYAIISSAVKAERGINE